MSLFLNNEPGGWYDPSDLTTLYQDAAGTTPVTAVEQPVGLVLDKSKGLVLGSELVTNGDFSNGTTGWTAAQSASLSVVGSFLRVTNVTAAFGGADQSITTVVGKSYKLVFTVGAQTGTSSVWVGTTSGGYQIKDFDAISSGTYTLIFTATSTTTYLRFLNRQNVSTNYSDFDNISVRELPGNHLSQSTSTARPVLSARVNLLTRTEEFDNAAWTRVGCSYDPTTDLLTASASSAYFRVAISQSTGVSYVLSVDAASGTTGWLYLFAQRGDGTNATAYVNTSTGAIGTTSNCTVTATASGSWFRFAMTYTCQSGAGNLVQFQMASANATPPISINDTVLIRSADLRPANAGVGLPAYQRVGAATSGTSSAAGNADYDATGFPYYLKFDGTDDSLSSGSIDFTSTDKMSVFAGVRKLSDAAPNMIAELGNDQTNAFSIGNYTDAGTQGPYYNFWSRGGIKASGFAWSGTFSAPITNVVTGLGNISGDSSILRVNSSEVASNTSDQGTGNYANASLFVGSRNNASLRFNGQLYSLIVRGAASTDAQIAATETWVNSKTKAY